MTKYQFNKQCLRHKLYQVKRDMNNIITMSNGTDYNTAKALFKAGANKDEVKKYIKHRMALKGSKLTDIELIMLWAGKVRVMATKDMRAAFLSLTRPIYYTATIDKATLCTLGYIYNFSFVEHNIILKDNAIDIKEVA